MDLFYGFLLQQGNGIFFIPVQFAKRIHFGAINIFNIHGTLEVEHQRIRWEQSTDNTAALRSPGETKPTPLQLK
jgi:hypothetical protein